MDKKLWFGDGFTTKRCEPCTEIKLKKIKEFRSLWLASLSSLDLSIVGSCAKRVCDRNTEVEAKKSEPRKWSYVSFRRGRSTSQQKSPQLDLLLPRITRLYYSAFHNF